MDAQLFDSFTANKFKFTPKQQLTEQGEPITMRQQPQPGAFITNPLVTGIIGIFLSLVHNPWHLPVGHGDLVEDESILGPRVEGRA